MQLIYQGKDITKDVDIIRAVHRDTSGNGLDFLDLTLDHSPDWFRWSAEVNDEIEFLHGGYSTGRLFVGLVRPEGEQFRIMAAGAKAGTKTRKWYGFRNATLSSIANICASESGMSAEFYGIDAKCVYPYLLRKNESGAEMLKRLLTWEGGALKAYSGKYIGIGIEYAQNMESVQTIHLPIKQQQTNYTRRDHAKLAGVIVKTPYATAEAADAAVKNGQMMVVTNLPAMESGTAKRWAKGLLLTHNRRAEELSFCTELDMSLTAMTRFNVNSQSEAAGEWLIDEVEHDFTENRSRVRALRCLRTVR